MAHGDGEHRIGAWRRTLAGAVLTLACVSPTASAGPLEFRGTAWAAAARPHGLDPALLYAVALAESRRTVGPGRHAPWPWVIRTPTGGYWFDSRAAAERGLRAVLAMWPAKRVDVGAAQINLGWHRLRFDDPARLFDLETNLRIAAGILADAVASTDDTVLGVGRYHHWEHEARTRAYGQRVWNNYRAVTFATADPSTRFVVADEHELGPIIERLAAR